MIQIRDYDNNIDREKILYLLDGWDTEENVCCIDIIYERILCTWVSKKNPDNPMYMEALEGDQEE